jgi:hypothetical protein
MAKTRKTGWFSVQNFVFKIWEKKWRSSGFWLSTDIWPVFVLKFKFWIKKGKPTSFLVYRSVFQHFSKFEFFWIVTDEFSVNRRNRSRLVFLVFTKPTSFHSYLNPWSTWLEVEGRCGRWTREFFFFLWTLIRAAESCSKRGKKASAELVRMNIHGSPTIVDRGRPRRGSARRQTHGRWGARPGPAHGSRGPCEHVDAHLIRVLLGDNLITSAQDQNSAALLRSLRSRSHGLIQPNSSKDKRWAGCGIRDCKIQKWEKSIWSVFWKLISSILFLKIWEKIDRNFVKKLHLWWFLWKKFTKIINLLIKIKVSLWV